MHDEANVMAQDSRIDLPLTGMVLDLGKGDLRDADGKRVELRPQAFQVLRFLAQNAGRVVTKDELHQASLGRHDSHRRFAGAGGW